MELVNVRFSLNLYGLGIRDYKYNVCVFGLFQKIYKTNNMHNPAAHAQYQLSELELPSKRPSGRGLSSPPSPGKSVLADMTYSIEMVSYFTLLTNISMHNAKGQDKKY